MSKKPDEKPAQLVEVEEPQPTVLKPQPGPRILAGKATPKPEK